MKRKNLVHIGAAIAFLLITALPGQARAFANTALTAFEGGVALPWYREGKAFLNANTSKITAESLPMLLNGVILTYHTFLDEGIEPDFVLSFSGANVGWLAEGGSDSVRGLIQQIDLLGIRIEVCAIALMMAGVDPDSVLPEIHIIDNNWVSAITHENNGYARVEF